MPVHVEQMTSEVTVLDGDLPLTEAQIEKLAQRVLKCLEDKQRDTKLTRGATAIKPQATSFSLES